MPTLTVTRGKAPETMTTFARESTDVAPDANPESLTSEKPARERPSIRLLDAVNAIVWLAEDPEPFSMRLEMIDETIEVSDD